MSPDRELLESRGSAKNISALARVRALTSRAARLYCGDTRRPASFEISVKINGVDDRVHGLLLLLRAGAQPRLSATDAYRACVGDYLM